jgi:ABC-2 type transport system permease protein
VLLGRTGELRVSPILAYGAPLAGILWLSLALWVFQREMRHYQSSGH